MDTALVALCTVHADIKKKQTINGQLASETDFPL